MRYDDARDLIQSGDLLAWRGETALGRLIRAVTGGSWSHVGVAWRFQGRLFVLETREGVGGNIRPLSAAVPFDWISTGVEWTAEAETFALDRLGRGYSYADAVRAGLGVDLAAFGDICSEYAGAVIAKADTRRDGVRRVLGSPGRFDFRAKLPKPLTPRRLVEHWLLWDAPLRSVRP